MANLSNINNKFIVTDGGQALVNQTVAGFNPDADDLIVGNLSGNTGITIASGSSAGNYGSIYFADGAGSSTTSKAGYIRYEQNTSKMTIGINAVEKIAIDLSGNVTLNSATALDFQVADFAQIKFRESGAITIDSDNNQSSRNFQIKDGSGSSLLTVLDTGNVGIGTTSPSTPLMVNRASNSNEPGIYYDVTGGSSGSVGIGSTAAFGPFIVGNTLPNGNVRGAYSASRMLFNGGGFAFQTSDETSGARTFDDKVKILINGNVGIGTASPDALLELEKSASGAVGPTLLLNNSAGGNADKGNIIFASFGNTYQRAKIEFKVSSETNNPGNIDFYTGRSDLGTLTQKMTILGSGNVGIGDTSAPNKLSVKDTAGNLVCRYTASSGAFSLYQNNTDGTVIFSANHGNTGSDNRFIWQSEGAIERMRLVDGSLAIGTTVMNGKLSVAADDGTSTPPLGSGIYVGPYQGNTAVGSAWSYSNSAATYTDFSSRYDSSDSNMRFIMKASATPVYAMTIKGSGKVFIGKQIESFSTAGWSFANTGSNVFIDSAAALNMNRGGSDGNIIQFFKSDTLVGSIALNASSTSYNVSSDYRLKENVVEMTGALDRVSQLKPSRFNFIADADKTVDGFLAHEVQEIIPEAITGEKDAIDEEGNAEYQGIDQSKLVPLLVGAIQELTARVKELENK